MGKEHRKDSADKEIVSLDTIILAGIERGLSLDDIRGMQVGQVVDFVIAYNERQKRFEKEQEDSEKPKKRRATQSEIDAFFG